MGNTFLHLFAALNCPSTFNASLKENSSARLFNCSCVASCGIKRAYERAFFYFLLFKILHITGTRCFSFAALPCSTSQCGIREKLKWELGEAGVMTEAASLGIKWNFLQRLNAN